MSKATKRERQKENRERAREERERLLKRDRQMKTLRGFLILLVPIAILVFVINAQGDDAAAFDKTKGYTATIQTSEGNIVIALDAKKAPIATKHFVELVDKKFYDGLCIDRLSQDFVIQGGSPNCDQKGGPGTTVSGELPTDHYPIGTLAAAKSGSEPAGTFGSQFFVVTGSRGATLPNDYARFGTVIAGLDVAQKIEKLPIKPGLSKTDGAPVTKITIKRITIKVTPKPVTSIASNGSGSSTTSAPAASSTTVAPSSTTVAPSTSSTTTKK